MLLILNSFSPEKARREKKDDLRKKNVAYPCKLYQLQHGSVLYLS